MANDDEWTKLPTSAKVQHKLWNARVTGYEEALKLFSTESEKSPAFNEYLGLMKKFVNDTHAGALEKALDAVLVFLENAAIAPKCAGDVCPLLVTKCLSSTRPKTKDKTIECLLMFIEIERHELVLDELMKGLSNKNPKVVVGCIQTIREALNLYGPTVVPMKPLFKEFSNLLEDRDKNVRNETKNLVVEVYRWAGPGSRDLLKDLKPVILTELNTLFESLPAEKPVRVRFLRSQRPKEEPAVVGGDQNQSAQTSKAGAATDEIDLDDLITPVEVLSKIPSDYWSRIGEKKWQDRRSALECLDELTNVPRIVPGDFGEVVKSLLQVVNKDTNIVLVALAAKILSQLAKGLKGKYGPYAQQTIQACLAKFKERKPNVVQVLREAIDNAFSSTTLDSITDDVIEALKHKTPGVRSEAALFLSRVFCKCTPTILNKKILKSFTTVLCTTSMDTVPEVRENSFAALGAAMYVVSVKNIQPFLSELDAIRMAKINECCEQIANEKNGSAGDSTSSGGAATATSAASKSTSAPRRGAPPIVRPNTAGDASDATVAEKTQSKPATKAAKPKSATGASAKTSAAPKTAEKNKPTIPTESVLSDEQLQQQSAEIFGETLVQQLSDANWKERLQAVEQISSKVKSMSDSDCSTQVLCRTILMKPGLKDTNVQVLRNRIEYIGIALAVGKPVSSNLAEILIPDLVDKIGDAKVGDVTKSVLTTLTEQTSFELVGGNLLQLTFQLKNPRNQSESLAWLNHSIRDFGFKLQPKEVCATLKTGLNATNPAVRQNCITLAGTVHLYIGDTLRALLADEKPAIQTLLNAEFAKNEGQKPPAPTRSTALDASRQASKAEPSEVTSAVVDTDVVIEDETELDILPVVDISDRFTSDLMNLLASKNWKERLEALNTIEKFLSPSSRVDGSNGKLQEPVTGISKACADVNKNLSRQALGILMNLAKSLSKADALNYLKVVEPHILCCMGDSKVQVREAAVSALVAWQSRVPLASMLENDMLSDALKVENPILRSEVLRWLTTALSGLPPNHLKRLVPELASGLLPQVFSCLEDRNPDARKQAQSVLPSLIQHLGWNVVSKSASKLKASSKDNVMQHLEKARESVPESQPNVETKQSSPPKAVRGGGGGSSSANTAAPAHAESETVVTETEDTESGSPSTVPSVRGGGKKKEAGKKSVTTKKPVEEEPVVTIPLPANKSARTARLNDEKKRKLLKWDFDAPTRDHVQQLNNLYASAGASTEFQALLFHTDFKQHIKAIDQLCHLLDSPEGEESTLINIDLILRWIVLRFFETNPVVVGRCLDYLIKLFAFMSETGTNLAEHEATAFIPYLIIKIGDPKDVIRQNVRNIFRLIVKIYPPSRVFVFLCGGLKSKTSKTRQECLEVMGSLIEDFGINVCQPTVSAALKLMAQQIGDRDKGVRTSALNALVNAYVIIGEQMWKSMNELSEKDRSMLEERIKRAKKPIPNSSSEVSDLKSLSRPPTSKRESPDNRRPVEFNDQDLRYHKPVSAAHARARAMLNELGDLSPEKAPNMPQLIQLEADINELFQPFEMPDLKAHARQPILNAYLRTSPDAASAITMVVTAITSDDLLVSCHAVSEIDTVLREEKWYLLLNYVNHILTLIIIQLKQVSTRYFGDPSIEQEQLRNLIRCHLATIDSLFNRSALAREASKETLRVLMETILQLMLDERVTGMPDGENVIRTINLLCVRIIESANRTRVLSASIQLLHECVSNGHFANRFTQAIMKSLWRITKNMHKAFHSYSLDVILLDCHLFLKVFPLAFWKNQKSDIPLRTIKTLLHMLCRLQGPTILKFLKNIPNKEDSELESYLMRTLKATAGLPALTSDSHKSSDPDSGLPKSNVPSIECQQRLADIFKKIGSKDREQGLIELYDFTQLYPDFDLTPELSKSSDYFQTYIKQGLRRIGFERSRQFVPSSGDDALRPKTSPLNGISSRPDMNSDYQLDQKADVKFFLNRLASLKRECGLPDTTGLRSPGADETLGVFGSTQLDGDEFGIRNPTFDTALKNLIKPSPGTTNSDQDPKSPNENQQPETRPTMSEAELMELKRRLERIKNIQKH